MEFMEWLGITVDIHLSRLAAIKSAVDDSDFETMTFSS